jgi:hypothetical protein
MAEQFGVHFTCAQRPGANRPKRTHMWSTQSGPHRLTAHQPPPGAGPDLLTDPNPAAASTHVDDTPRFGDYLARGLIKRSCCRVVIRGVSFE